MRRRPSPSNNEEGLSLSRSLSFLANFSPISTFDIKFLQIFRDSQTGSWWMWTSSSQQSLAVTLARSSVTMRIAHPYSRSISLSLYPSTKWTNLSDQLELVANRIESGGKRISTFAFVCGVSALLTTFARIRWLRLCVQSSVIMWHNYIIVALHDVRGFPSVQGFS